MLESLSINAHALEWVEVEDASKLLWQIYPDGTFWFRNLNEFNPHMRGCCYNYSLNTTTAAGRSFYSMLLMKIAEHKRVTLGFEVGSEGTQQPLLYLGRHDHATNE